MPSTDRKVRVYEELAEWEENNGTPQARDRFLILAADAALSAGLNDEAEALRTRLLDGNPHHLLKPYRTLAEAMKSSDVYSYVADLRGSYPADEAEHELESIRNGKVPTPAMEPPPSAPAITPRMHEEPVLTPREMPATLPMEPVSSQPQLHTLRVPELEVKPKVAKVPTRKDFTTPAEPSRRTRMVDEAEERPSALGIWISDFFFYLLVAVGALFFAYTMARPFLPLPENFLK